MIKNNKRLAAVATGAVLMATVGFGTASAAAGANYSPGSSGSEAVVVAATTPSVDPSKYPAYSASQVYQTGDRVTFQGKTYEAAWVISHQAPDATNPFGPWQEIGAPVKIGNQVVDTWTASRVYQAGDRAVSGGKVWQARWWTRNQQPKNVASSPWQIVK